MRISTSSLFGQLAGLAVGAHVEADDRGVRRRAERDVVLGDAADGAVHEAELDLVALELAQALGDRFERPCTSAFRMRLSVAFSPDWIWLNMSSSLRARLDAGVAAQVTGLAAVLAGLADGAGDLLVGRGTELVAGLGHRDRPSTWTGVDGPAVLTCSPLSLIIARTLPHAAPATIGSPTLSSPLSTSTVATGPRPLSRLASSTMPLARPVGVGAEVLELGDHDAAGRAGRRCRGPGVADISTTIVSPPHDSGTSSCSASWAEHALRVGVVLVDLVDRHHDRHVGGAGVVDRLDRLRHDAVVGGDDEHDDVGRLGAAGPHLRERRVAGRVDERDRRPFRSTW